MSKHSAVHATFTIERNLAATPERVYKAFADPAAKRKWFVGPSDWEGSPLKMDFKVGGKETVSGGPQKGPIHTYTSTFMDIVPNQRIVTCYEMHMDKVRISVSVATLEFASSGKGTKLKLTEQGVFLDGYDDAGSRERGTRGLLDQLEASLK